MGRPRKKKVEIEQEDEDFIDDLLKDVPEKNKDIREVLDIINKLDKNEVLSEIEALDKRIKGYTDRIKSMRKEIDLLKYIHNLKAGAGEEFRIWSWEQ